MSRIQFSVTFAVAIGIAAGTYFLAAPLYTLADSPSPPISKPESRPEFRKLLNDEEYQRRFQAVLQGLGDLDALANSEVPAQGVEVTAVTQESQADEAGIKPGDVVVKFDDDMVWVKDMLPRSDQSQTMEYYSQGDRALRSMPLDSGRIGIQVMPYWRPEVLYLHEAGRDKRWEQQVVVGLTTLLSDPELAETAWSHAIDAGYPQDHRSALAGAVLALGQGRTEIAGRFFDLARQGGIDSTLWYHPTIIYRLAIASGQLTEAMRVAEKYRGAFGVVPELLQLLIDASQPATGQPSKQTPLSQHSEGMYRDNLLSRSRGRNLNSTSLFLPAVQREGMITLSAPTAHFKILHFGISEPIDSFDLQMQFTVKVHDDKTSRFSKQFAVTVIDNDAAARSNESLVYDEILLQAVIDEHSYLSLQHSNLPLNFDYYDPRFEFSDKQTHELRMIRVRDRAEILIDGNHVLDVPVYVDPIQLSFHLKVVGVDAEILSLSVDELIEKP